MYSPRIYPWDIFFDEKVRQILRPGMLVVDIGGGLRVDPARNNRKGIRHEYVALSEAADYKVLDKVADYKPDVVGDIQNLPFADNSVDAILCLSVLTHVEDPEIAIREMYRVLKPGGRCLISVPFIYYYHPIEGYYKDFWRFSDDAVTYLTRDFASTERMNIRGAISTVFNLLPIFSGKYERFFYCLDKLSGKVHSKQTSGYHVFCIK